MLGQLKISGLVGAVLLGASGVSAAPKGIKNLVAFGDSYTDKVFAWGGGLPWPLYVQSFSNNTVSVYDFAHTGATCSNKISPRTAPAVLEGQIPEYTANITKKSGNTYIIGANGTYVPLASKDTVYSIWIGTNDVGTGQLLTDPLKDVSIVNTTACVFDWVRTLYNQGARNFLIQNMIPLHLTPMYSSSGYSTKFWNEPHNQTEWGIFMAELVRSGNELQELRAKYIAPSQFPGIFDSYGLFKDIYNNPAKYLVGPTYNVKDAWNTCKYDTNNTLVCAAQPESLRSSYLWWDELHPTEQAGRVVARYILNALRGDGPFVSWYGAK